MLVKNKHIIITNIYYYFALLRIVKILRHVLKLPDNPLEYKKLHTHRPANGQDSG